MGMLVLKDATSLAQRSLNPLMELDSKLLYQACADSLKVVGMIFHINSLSWITNSKILCTFYTCSLESTRLLYLSYGNVVLKESSIQYSFGRRRTLHLICVVDMYRPFLSPLSVRVLRAWWVFNYWVMIC